MESCLICLESTDIYALLNCGCKFNIHKQCFNSWLNIHNSCIYCKKKIFLTNKKISIIFKYLDKEFEHCKTIHILDFLLKKIFYMSTNINNVIVKTLVFNCFLGLLIFTILVPTLLYLLFLSQIKYTFDYIKGKEIIYNEPILYKKIEK